MRFLSVIFLMLLVSCSSLPPKTEAIHITLVTDAALRNATQTCAELGVEERRFAERERVSWWRRNGNFVMAADYGLLQLNWDDSPQSAEHQRAVLAMQVLENIQTDSELLYADWFGDYQESKDCKSLFGQVAKGKYDVEGDKKIAEVLAQISSEKQSVSADAERARSINSRYRKYGRSLYIVEKELQDVGCRAPKISLLRNSWPLETYDAVCSQQDYILVKCEWGRCELKL